MCTNIYAHIWGFPGGASGKEPVCQCSRCKRPGFDPWVGKFPWRRKWQPIPVFLPGKSHGQRSLAKEFDMSEHACTHTHFFSHFQHSLVLFLRHYNNVIILCILILQEMTGHRMLVNILSKWSTSVFSTSWQQTRQT